MPSSLHSPLSSSRASNDSGSSYAHSGGSSEEDTDEEDGDSINNNESPQARFNRGVKMLRSYRSNHKS